MPEQGARHLYQPQTSDVVYNKDKSKKDGDERRGDESKSPRRSRSHQTGLVALVRGLMCRPFARASLC